MEYHKYQNILHSLIAFHAATKLDSSGSYH